MTMWQRFEHEFQPTDIFQNIDDHFMWLYPWLLPERFQCPAIHEGWPGDFLKADQTANSRRRMHRDWSTYETTTGTKPESSYTSMNMIGDTPPRIMGRNTGLLRILTAILRKPTRHPHMTKEPLEIGISLTTMRTHHAIVCVPFQIGSLSPTHIRILFRVARRNSK